MHDKLHEISKLLEKKRAVMIRYTSQKQLTIEEFKTPFQMKLDKENRWVKLASIMPWDSLAQIYYRKMSASMGAPAINARIVIGAMIIKHKLNLDDRETIETIRENIYIQYFLGLSQYTYEDVFDRSLFTTLRNRLGIEEFDEMTRQIILKAEGKEEAPKKTYKTEDIADSQTTSNASGASNEMDAYKQQQDKDKNAGTLIIDATVADQKITYPNDLGLLSDCREESERIIDILCKPLNLKEKPRTYRRKARKQYLLIARKKNKSKKELHKAIGQQLRYVKRNLKSIDALLDKFDNQPFPLNRRDQKIYWVIQQIYDQQNTMHRKRVHSIEHRIVNIFQPYVRPIVRGKDRAHVEFGAKLGVSLQGGYARINNISWEAYNESSDLKKQVEDYRQLNGYYPAVVIADKIYGTRENRQWLKERDIRYSGKSLGRPPVEQLIPYQKRKQKEEKGKRNHIEGKFGQGKNAYELNKIRAKTAKTSESWIAAIFFVMNLIRFSKDFLFSFFHSFIKLILSHWLRKKLDSAYAF